MSVANNHVFDLGANGLRQSLEILGGAGIAAIGAGADPHEARKPFIQTVRGLKVGVVAFAEMLNHRPDQGAAVARLQDDAVGEVRALKGQVDVTIVSVHWGEQFKDHHDRNQTLIARRLIDAGADAIIGHHSHTLQAVEIYRGRPVFYSLGNFIWGRQTSPVELSAIADISFRKAESPLVRVRVHPVYRTTNIGVPRLATGKLAGFVRGALSGRSRLLERGGAFEVELH